MKSVSIVVGTVSSVLLLGAGAVLHLRTPVVPDERFRAAIESVQAIQQLGAEWSMETARVRANPTANFDGLAAFVPTMLRLKEDLSENLAHIPDLPERLTADSRAYLAAMEALRERVERFKTAYAVIRNSERYFPLASADLILRAEQAGSKSLAREVADITMEMEAYLVSPSESVKTRLEERLGKLDEAKAGEADAIASSVANFSAHASALLDKRGRFQELFSGIMSSALSERAKPLADNLEAELAERHRIRAFHRQVLIGLGAAVLLIWVFVGFSRRPVVTGHPSAAPDVRPQGHVVEAEVTAAPEPASAALLRADTHGIEARLESPAEEALADQRRWTSAGAQRDAEGMDVLKALLTTGALAGLMSQILSAYIHRIDRDLKELRSGVAGTDDSPEPDDMAQRWRRVLSDVRRLGFFAHRMGVLGRRLAPKDRESIDVNRSLDDVLHETGADMSCVVARHFGKVPDVQIASMEFRLIVTACVDQVLRAFQDGSGFEAELEVRTAPYETGVEISFVHNGAELPPEQRRNQFLPFYGSQDDRAALELPAALFLARKYGGTIALDTLPDERTALHVRLPIQGGGG